MKTPSTTPIQDSVDRPDDLNNCTHTHEADAPASDAPLSDDEAADLAAHEDAIRRYERAGIEAGRALKDILDRRLYRAGHPTFEAYVDETWSFTSSRAYQLVRAAEVHDGLDDAGFDVLPQNEAQARPLAPLSATERGAVWRRVVDAGKPTAESVREAAYELGYGSAPTPEATPDPTAGWPTEAVQALRAVPEAHRPALAAAVAAEVPSGAVTADVVAEAAEGYGAAVLEDGDDPSDWTIEHELWGPPDVPGHPDAWRGDGAAIPLDGTSLSAPSHGSAAHPILDLDVLPDADVPDDLQPPSGAAHTPVDATRHPAARKGSKLFLGTSETRPLLVSLPLSLVPEPLLDRSPLSTDGLSRVVVEVGELERAGGPVDGGVLRLDEVRAHCNAEGIRPTLHRTNEHVDWARYTSNPLTGCWHGCRHEFCYAAGIARRMSCQGFLPTLYPDRLDHFANTRVPDVSGLDREEAWRERSVFMVSMGDLFGSWVPAYYVEAVLDEVRRHPEWFCFFLTKNPKGLDRFTFPSSCSVGLTLTGDEPHGTGAYSPEQRADLYATYARQLGQVKGAAFTWLSVEPLRADVGDLAPFFGAGVQMVAVGAQSATTLTGRDGRPLYSPARQPEVAWVESIRRQVRAEGVRLFEKANLAVRPKEIPFPDGRPADAA